MQQASYLIINLNLCLKLTTEEMCTLIQHIYTPIVTMLQNIYIYIFLNTKYLTNRQAAS